MLRTARAALVVVLALGATTAAFADTTVKMTIATVGGPMAVSMETTSYYKGLKLRSDVKIMDQAMSLLIDAAAKQQMMLNHVTKQVMPVDVQAAMANLPVTMGDPTVSVKPSGQSKEILGRMCDGYTVEMSVPMTVNGETITMKMSGPAWLTKQGAGADEIIAFQKAAAGAGLAVSPLGQGMQAKGMAEMAKAFVDAGMLMSEEMSMAFEGTGQIAQMMGQMAMTMTMTVTEVTSAPIPDEKFVVPADYKK